ncbi:MAG: DUF192 domain-containing protein [Syntrophorhabdaceae bacterium]|nr:DUF192 domain-containing protein [Syntrophorhabdaceae bacterium]
MKRMGKKRLHCLCFITLFFLHLLINGCFFHEAAAREGSVVFYEGKDKILCAFTVELAITEFEQTRGLMFRRSLKKGHGMLFIHSDDEIRHYWMKNTYIPLDLIFIDSGMTVVDIYRDAKPLDETTISSKARARYVLEIASGEADACRIKKGTKVRIVTNQ